MHMVFQILSLKAPNPAKHKNVSLPHCIHVTNRLLNLLQAAGKLLSMHASGSERYLGENRLTEVSLEAAGLQRSVV